MEKDSFLWCLLCQQATYERNVIVESEAESSKIYKFLSVVPRVTTFMSPIFLLRRRQRRERSIRYCRKKSLGTGVIIQQRERCLGVYTKSTYINKYTEECWNVDVNEQYFYHTTKTWIVHETTKSCGLTYYSHRHYTLLCCIIYYALRFSFRWLSLSLLHLALAALHFPNENFSV